MSFLLDEVLAVLDNEPGLVADKVEYFINDAEVVSDEYVDSLRWTELWTAVIKRGNEYVGLDYEVPATEYQEGSEGESEAYEVRPVQVTITKYEKV